LGLQHESYANAHFIVIFTKPLKTPFDVVFTRSSRTYARYL
jgi:hypothetical protein